LLLVSACTGPIDYKPLDAPEPSTMDTRSNLEIELVELESNVPAVGSDDTLDFVVRIINSGNKTFVWPDPCPVYYWGWGTTVNGDSGDGYRYLNCAGAPDLGPMGSADFAMEIPAAESYAEGFGWDLTGFSRCDTFAFGFAYVEILGPKYSGVVDDCKKDDNGLFAGDD
jgi:hypothetical protein